MSQVAEKIAFAIRKRRAISFARFMHLALYCPVYGYYEKEGDNPGRRGDFYTSVSVGGLFGELLASQFAKWLEQLAATPDSTDHPLALVEAGAHRGELARDILLWLLANAPGTLARITYWIIEPSERRQQWQRRCLKEVSGSVRWVKSLGRLAAALQKGAPGIKRGKLRGCVFSNELLDSFPVHRLGWDAPRHEWFEWGVQGAAPNWTWTRLPVPSWLAAHLYRFFEQHELEKLQAHLPDQFTLELAPEAVRWWRQAARLLQAGKLLTIDYGLTSDELLLPHRDDGTLRGYRHHQTVADVLSNPGEQDLTAHVNFSALQKTGEEARLRTEGLFTQAQFLTSIAAPSWEGNGPLVCEWTAERRRQFQTLTHPEHLGRAFRVLIQSR